jgi:hypothetical protein
MLRECRASSLNFSDLYFTQSGHLQPITTVLPALSCLLGLTIQKSVLQKQIQHWQFSPEKINRTLNQGQQRPDLGSMTKRDDAGVEGITISELNTTTSLLIVGCSETTVTVLSGIANYLVKSPDKLNGLTNEARSSFRNESEMTLSALKELQYLGAIIQEGLRLCNPTVGITHYARLLLILSRPVGLPRIVSPGGGSVAGNWLPGRYIRQPPSTSTFSFTRHVP